MSRKKRPPRARTVLRRRRIEDEKLVRARRKLLELEPGGSARHPVDVATASLVEPKAKAVLCPRCNQPFDVESHEAHSDERGRLREARLRCRVCGERRSHWFRIVAPS